MGKLLCEVCTTVHLMHPYSMVLHLSPKSTSSTCHSLVTHCVPCHHMYPQWAQGHRLAKRHITQGGRWGKHSNEEWSNHSKECSAHPPSSIFFTYHRRGSFLATSLTFGCRLEWDQVLPRLSTSLNPPHILSGYGPTRSTSTQPSLSTHISSSSKRIPLKRSAF